MWNRALDTKKVHASFMQTCSRHCIPIRDVVLKQIRCQGHSLLVTGIGRAGGAPLTWCLVPGWGWRQETSTAVSPRAECQHMRGSLQTEQSHSRDRCHRSSHSHPHRSFELQLHGVRAASPITHAEQGTASEIPAAARGKGFSNSPTQLQHRTIKRAAAPSPPITLPSAATGP